MRRGTGLVEVLTAASIGLSLLAVGYRGIGRVVGLSGLADREASRNLARTRLLESLLSDLRSSVPPVAATSGAVSFERWALVGGRLATRAVRWRELPGPRVVRSAAGEPDRVFDFTGLVDRSDPVLELKIEKVSDAVFVP